MELLSEPFIKNNEIPEKLKPYLDKYAVAIAGGAARQLYLDDGTFGTTDIDLYFLTKKHYKDCKFAMLSNFVLDDMHRDNNQPDYPALTYVFKDLGKIQFIKKEYPGTIDLFNSFDFTCCQFCLFDNILYYTKEAIEDLASKSLRATPYGQIHNYRIMKYVQKGYTPVGVLEDTFESLIIETLKCSPQANQLELEYFIAMGEPPFRHKLGDFLELDAIR